MSQDRLGVASRGPGLFVEALHREYSPFTTPAPWSIRPKAQTGHTKPIARSERGEMWFTPRPCEDLRAMRIDKFSVRKTQRFRPVVACVMSVANPTYGVGAETRTNSLMRASRVTYFARREMRYKHLGWPDRFSLSPIIRNYRIVQATRAAGKPASTKTPISPLIGNRGVSIISTDKPLWPRIASTIR